MEVRRTDPTQIFRDHEKRIRSLERAPSSTQIYVDDRVITDPVPVVTFTDFPSTREILELTFRITVDDYPAWTYIAFNDDYPVNVSNDYRWRLFGDIAAAENDTGPTIWNWSGAVGGAALGDYSSYGPNWGRIRFPDYNNPDFAAALWQGDGGILGDDGEPHTWLISGCGDPQTPITSIHVFAALDLSTGPDAVQIVAPSRLTLTCY